MIQLARAEARPGEGPLTAAALAEMEDIPLRFLRTILLDLRRGELVRSQRGAEGGYRLAKAADLITVADVLRTVEGPLADVRGQRPEDLTYPGFAAPLQEVWIAVGAAVRAVLEHVTLADLASGRLPPSITDAASPSGDIDLDSRHGEV